VSEPNEPEINEANEAEAEVGQVEVVTSEPEAEAEVAAETPSED